MFRYILCLVSLFMFPLSMLATSSQPTYKLELSGSKYSLRDLATGRLTDIGRTPSAHERYLQHLPVIRESDIEVVEVILSKDLGDRWYARHQQCKVLRSAQWTINSVIVKIPRKSPVEATFSQVAYGDIIEDNGLCGRAWM